MKDKFIVLYGKDDPAAANIIPELNRISDIKIKKLDQHPIYAENIDKEKELKDFDYIIFASTHKSVQHNKTLSVHAPGNWHEAKLGGNPGEIAMSSALFNKYLFKILNEENEKAKSEYKITLEVTHHGPIITTKPCCFIEIGSGEEEWNDKQAALIIARTIKKATESFSEKEAKEKFIPAIGIGGRHYCANFNKIQLNSEYALAHIIPEHALPLTEKMLHQAKERTSEHPKIIILDWKGLGNQEIKNPSLAIIEKLGFKILRTSQIEK